MNLGSDFVTSPNPEIRPVPGFRRNPNCRFNQLFKLESYTNENFVRYLNKNEKKKTD